MQEEAKEVKRERDAMRYDFSACASNVIEIQSILTFIGCSGYVV